MTAGAATLDTRQGDAIRVEAVLGPRDAEILTRDALAFLSELHRRFDGQRMVLLEARTEKQRRYDAGDLPDFRTDTRGIREAAWRVAPVPADLQRRAVELTGPVDRKMVINALNSGADVYMGDFEDATSPTWRNLLDGQVNLLDYWRGALSFDDPESGKSYAVGEKPALLMVRPRGFHLLEEHVLVDDAPVAGSFFDFGLYSLHNAREILRKGATPAFYLPKLETMEEAALWDEIFAFTEARLGLKHGALKATVLVETLPAAFEMDEILHAMRDHIVGLNCGRWDYIFSFIKRLRAKPDRLTPDRGLMTMDKGFLRAYALLLIRVCHRRGVFAMGGMAAQIPNRRDPAANEKALERVRADKEREAGDGYDGTWVAHPDLVPVAKEIFDREMPDGNQVGRLREDVAVTRDDLLQVHEGPRTEAGLRENIRVGVQYIEAWLGGRGAVPLYNLMEDAATAEISRVQVWQWLKHRARLDDGRVVTPDLFRAIMASEMKKVRRMAGQDAAAGGRLAEAERLFADLALSAELEEFLTVPAYELIR
jgi:malate synthase